MTFKNKPGGFTIVELLIVIVVIAILAAISTVAYNGITDRATTTSLKSNLSGAARVLASDNARNGSYPATADSANNGKGLQSPPGGKYQYSYRAADNYFCLTVTSTKGNGYSYKTSSQDQTVSEGACSGHTMLDPDLMQPLATMHNYISGIAIDNTGGYYLISPDGYSPRIQVLDQYHTETARFGTTGTAQDQLGTGSYSSWGIFAGPDGNIYAADGGNGAFKVYTKNGTFIRAIGFGTGTSDGYLSRPYGLAFDSAGNIWVADRGNQRIQKFSSTGTYISKFGSAGSANGQFSEPMSVAIDSQDNIYVADRNNNRVQKFDKNGTFLYRLGTGTAGSADGQLNQPVFILIDSANGDIYIYELNNMRISIFNSSGAFQRKFSTNAPGSSTQRSFNMAWEPNGDITIATQSESQAYKLLTFSKQGNFVRAY